MKFKTIPEQITQEKEEVYASIKFIDSQRDEIRSRMFREQDRWFKDGGKIRVLDFVQREYAKVSNQLWDYYNHLDELLNQGETPEPSVASEAKSTN